MIVFFALFALLMALPVVWPQIDLIISGWFYAQGASGQGFFLADAVPFVSLHWLAYDGARVVGVVCGVAALAAFLRRRDVTGIAAKGWLFVLLALLIGPGLIANAALKDHWGRARPHEVVEFGGSAVFTPALQPHFEKAHSNGSFVCGDGAFGFFLPAFAYVAPRRRSRAVFWGGMGMGCLFSLARIAQGGHFFSDCVYAAFFMLVSIAGLHAAMYGREQTGNLWRLWFSRSAV